MPQVINTNIASLTARNNLNRSQSALTTSIERLSSGLRINSAKDDAAGLAIATRFTTQINGLIQASRNANDGISLAQTSEGALGTVTDNLQRIRQLAVQAVNATNSDSDRAALNAEVQQRLAEVTRIANQTSFNGRHVLDGSFGSAAFQVGANVGETISIDLSQGTRADQIGEVAHVTSAQQVSKAFTPEAGSTGAVATFDGLHTDPTAASFVSTNTVVADYSGAGNSKSFDVDGVTVTLDQDYTSDMAGLVQHVQDTLGDDYVVSDDGSNHLEIETVATGSTATMSITDTDTVLGSTTVTPGADPAADFDYSATNKTFTIDGTTIALTTDQTDQATLVTTIQTALGSDYVVAANGDAGFTVTTAELGKDVSIEVGGTDADFVTKTEVGTGDKALVIADGDFTIQSGGGDAVSIHGTFESVDDFVSAINAAGINGVSAYIDGNKNLVIDGQKDVTLAGAAVNTGGVLDGTLSAGTTNTSGNLADVNVLTVAGANDVINRVDSALSTVSSVRSDLGAIQNRFESTIQNVSVSSQNLTSARSRIQDADFAAVTASLTRAQILQQAGTAMVAQANALPNTVLSLLR